MGVGTLDSAGSPGVSPGPWITGNLGRSGGAVRRCCQLRTEPLPVVIARPWIACAPQAEFPQPVNGALIPCGAWVGSAQLRRSAQFRPARRSRPGTNASAAARPSNRISRAGTRAAPTLSSLAYWNTRTARVSKSNGRSAKVRGNSFTTSTNTSRPPTSSGPRSSGRCTRFSTAHQPHPSPVAASSRLGGNRSKAASRSCFETARKRSA